MIDYKLNYTSPDFEKTKPWTFTIDGITLTWAPQSPFIMSGGTKDGNHITNQILMFISSISVDRNNEFPATATGPMLVAHPSAPYTVLYAIYEIYGDELEILSFSENAPKLSDFNGDEEDSTDEEVVY